MSVLDGAICSSGISSPVAGSLYWMKLWWDSSVSSSIRMPVWRRTWTAAQVQNALCSSRVRSRCLPPPGSCAQVRPAEAWVLAGRRRVWPAAVNSWPGAVASAARSRSAAACRSASTLASSAGKDRDALAGPLVHPRLAAGSLLAALGDVGVADRARRGPGPPPGRVVGCPLGQVEVEGADRDQVVEGVDPGRIDLGDVPAG